MDDETLDRAITASRYGDSISARGALLEIADRLVRGRSLTSPSIAALAAGLLGMVESDHSLQFLAKDRRPRKGRPRKDQRGTIGLLLERAIFRSAIKDGFTRSPPSQDFERSAFAETARRLGFTGDAALTEALRLVKTYQRNPGSFDLDLLGVDKGDTDK